MPFTEYMFEYVNITYLEAGYSAKCCEKLANSPAYLSKTFFMRPVFRFIKHNLSIYYLFYALLINVDVQKLHIII